MCGIIAVARRPSDRTPPRTGDVLALVDGAAEQVSAGRTAGDVLARLATATERLAAADAALQGTPGVRALLADPAPGERVGAPPGRRGRSPRRPRVPPGGPPRRRALGGPGGRQRRRRRRARRGLGRGPRPPADGPGGGRTGRSVGRPGRDRGHDLGAGGPVGPRSPRGAGSRLRRAQRPRPRARARPRLAAGRGDDRRPLRPGLHLRLGRRGRRQPVVRLQGGGRDR